MKALHRLHPFLLPLIVILFSFRIPICFSSDWYNSCGEYFNCGNIINVGFPFWGGGTRPNRCGYPDLELSCEDNVTAIIHSMGIKYHILEMNQETHIMRIAREDFLQEICMQKFQNTTLNFKLFDYAPGSHNLTVLYGCPAPHFYTVNPSQFTCRITGTNDTYSYPVKGSIGPSGCYASVVVPVVKSSAAQIGNQSLSQIIGKGFEATYKVEGGKLCAKCEASKGRCGFDLSKNQTSCLCADGSVGHKSCSASATPGLRRTLSKSKIVIIASFSGTAISLCLLSILSFYIKRRNSSKINQDVEDFLKKYGSPGPKMYTYADLKRITNSFKDKLGEGGYGVVYRGKLHNGHMVAVKILKQSKADMEEFINEVASVGKTNHVNIVKLLGYCFEGQKRALVYNYMPNGSLEKFTYGGQKDHQLLSWGKLLEIAVGIARGLEYLHQGCNTRILHFDIKPQNILLDENFCPKISDFGLAKSCPQKDSIISMSEARGTIGYIAPEVFFKSFGGVSHKSDVYSYGMLVLEMVGCRNNADAQVECSTSEQYFPHWIHKQLEQAEELDHQEIENSEEDLLRRKMVFVSLWCIQTNPYSRPTMTRVVEMLTGTLESLEVPPVPSFGSSMRPKKIISTTIAT